MGSWGFLPLGSPLGAVQKAPRNRPTGRWAGWSIYPPTSAPTGERRPWGAWPGEQRRGALSPAAGLRSGGPGVCRCSRARARAGRVFTCTSRTGTEVDTGPSRCLVVCCRGEFSSDARGKRSPQGELGGGLRWSRLADLRGFLPVSCPWSGPIPGLGFLAFLRCPVSIL